MYKNNLFYNSKLFHSPKSLGRFLQGKKEGMGEYVEYVEQIIKFVSHVKELGLQVI